ncbi:MAG: hypothetical protein JXQ82_03070 [Methanomicrobiaceae archaeon]|nr:hypothetical protein [Methanomicrobiaceae archaeon]
MTAGINPESLKAEYVRTEWRSHTMRTIDAALTPGTISNAILVAGASIVLKKHRIHLMAASVAISGAAELWNKRCPPR